MKQLLDTLPDIKNLPAKRFTWDFRQQSFRFHMLKEPIENFLQWSTSVECLYTGVQIHIEQIYSILPDRYKAVIEDTKIGNPQNLYNNSSGTYILQAYYLYIWEKETGKRIEELNSILEFGGGYGVMPVICNRLGYKGEYNIIDLPELELLQKYYTEKNHTTIYHRHRNKVDLLIAACSLSEIPTEEVIEFLNKTVYKHNIIVYQKTWDYPSIENLFPDSTHIDNTYFNAHRIAIK